MRMSKQAHWLSLSASVCMAAFAGTATPALAQDAPAAEDDGGETGNGAIIAVIANKNACHFLYHCPGGHISLHGGF